MAGLTLSDIVTAEKPAGEAPPPEMKLGTLGEVPGQAASGANTFLANIIDAPVDVASGVSQMLGGPNFNNPVKDLFGKIGLIQPPSGTVIGNMARSGGNMVGAGLATGPLGALAPAAVEATATAGAPIARTLAQLVQRMMPSSGAQLATDTATAATAGAAGSLGGTVGHTVGGQIGGDTGAALGEAAGNVAGTLVGGGFSPLVIAGNSIMKAINFVRRGFAKEALDTAVNKQVQNVIQPGVTSDAARTGMDKANTLAEKIPGFNPSTAEATGSPSLVAKQQEREAAASGTALETAAARRQGNMDAVEAYRAANEPPGADNLTSVVDAATGHVQGLRETNAKAQTANAAGLPNVPKEQSGATMRSRFDTLRNASRQAFDGKAKALNLDGADLTPAFQEYAQNVEHLVVPNSFFARPGDVAPTLTERVLAPLRRLQGKTENSPVLNPDGTPYHGPNGPPAAPKPITFSDLKYLRERLSDGIVENLSGANPNRAYVRQMVIAKKKLDDMLVSLPGGPEYQAFIKDYFQNYVSRFEKGSAFKINQKNQQGFYQMPDERVANAFIDGSRTNAAQYRATFGDDPAAMNAIHNALLDDYRAVAAPDGIVNPAAAAKWMTKHEGFFREFPEMGVKPLDLLARSQELNATRETIENSALVRATDQVGKQTLVPEVLIQRALKNPALADQLHAAVAGSPEATAALARHLYNVAPPGETLSEFLTNPLVQKVLSPEHRAALANVFDANNMIANTRAMAGTPAHVSPFGMLQEQLGVRVPQVASRMFAVSSGRTSERMVLTEAAARFFNRVALAKTNDLLDHALYDRGLAQSISDSVYRNLSPGEFLVRMKPWLVYYGLEAPIDNGGNGTDTPPIPRGY